MSPITPRAANTGSPSSSSRKQQNLQQHQHQQHHEDDINNTNIMTRRRDKRRHVTPNSVDLRDPYSIIALAIRFDETVAGIDDERILQVPLETGPLYNPKAFAKALQFLQNQATPPKALRRITSSPPKGSTEDPASSSSNVPLPSTDFAPKQAITPIILSGLVAAIQDQQQQDEEEDENKNDKIDTDKTNNKTKIIVPSAFELVAYCRSMRRAALRRLRLRRKRRQVQRNVTPLILLGIVLGMITWSTSSVRTTVAEYGFVEGSCQANKACRLAATRVWEYCDPSHKLTVSGCTLGSCPVVEGQLEYPLYAMHTLFRPSYLRLSEVEQYQRQVGSKSSSKRIFPPPQRVWPLRRPNTIPQQSAIRWLGESNLNRVIRENINQFIPSTQPVHMLDCGCGIGGTLYALLDAKNPPSKTFRYHGISLSEPEIVQAKQYLSLHGLDTEKAAQQTNSDIVLERRDYDEPFNHQSYNAIVAIESLSYSPNITKTLENLVSALQPKGLLLIMDDVLASWVSGEDADKLKAAMGKPSLLTWEEWEEILDGPLSHMTDEYLYDLTIEFDMSLWLREESAEGLLNVLSDWRYRIAQKLSENRMVWFGSSGDTPDERKPLSMMQLVQNLAEKSRSYVARQQAYRRADMSFYYIVLSKK